MNRFLFSIIALCTCMSVSAMDKYQPAYSYVTPSATTYRSSNNTSPSTEVAAALINHSFETFVAGPRNQALATQTLLCNIDPDYISSRRSPGDDTLATEKEFHGRNTPTSGRNTPIDKLFNVE